jgi:methyl-accepting chemotaxis protein
MTDRVHEWNDLASNLSDAMLQLQKVAAQSTSSFSEVAAAMKNFAALANDVTVMPGDTSRNRYKTLNPAHEVL